MKSHGTPLCRKCEGCSGTAYFFPLPRHILCPLTPRAIQSPFPRGVCREPPATHGLFGLELRTVPGVYAPGVQSTSVFLLRAMVTAGGPGAGSGERSAVRSFGQDDFKVLQTPEGGGGAAATSPNLAPAQLQQHPLNPPARQPLFARNFLSRMFEKIFKRSSGVFLGGCQTLIFSIYIFLRVCRSFFWVVVQFWPSPAQHRSSPPPPPLRPPGQGIS